MVFANVLKGVLFGVEHDVEGRRNMVVLEYTAVVVADRQIMLGLNEEGVSDSRVLVVVDHRRKDPGQLFVYCQDLRELPLLRTLVVL